MPNKNYQKGVRKERKIVNAARARGLIAFRSAGSHSAIDVCIIDQRNCFIYFVQCKPDTMSEKEKERIKLQFSNMNQLKDLRTWRVSFEVL